MIVALDFDGVICNGLVEYFATTKKAYQKIWNPLDNKVGEELAPTFYKLRPVIEIGWEMPVLLRAIETGITSEEILLKWHSIRDSIVVTEKLDTKVIGETVDKTRDRWIQEDEESWLSLHSFYPGVLNKIKGIIDSSDIFYIVTTKEGRFVKKLLQQAGFNIAPERIIGKEVKRPKYETLRLLKNNIGERDIKIHFVEDRLKTLQLVKQQPDLQQVKLYLADWGYNTDRDRNKAMSDPNIELLSLENFLNNFPV